MIGRIKQFLEWLLESPLGFHGITTHVLRRLRTRREINPSPVPITQRRVLMSQEAESRVRQRSHESRRQRASVAHCSTLHLHTIPRQRRRYATEITGPPLIDINPIHYAAAHVVTRVWWRVGWLLEGGGARWSTAREELPAAQGWSGGR